MNNKSNSDYFLKFDISEPPSDYDAAMKIVEPILEKEFEGRMHQFGICHLYWNRKKELLAKHSVDWKTPDELNPGVLFD